MNCSYCFILAGLFFLFSNHSFSQSKSAKKDKSNEVMLKTEMDNVSYSLGVTVGTNLKMSGLDSLNYEAFATAIKDVYASQLKIDEDSAKWILDNYFNKLQSEQSQQSQNEGRSFLEKNKATPGIVQLQSGLQYRILTNGTGPKPNAKDTVSVHYTGKLVNGTVFDSSIDADPATFPVSMVIPGWTEALQLMPVGSKWILYIPSNLAYGERGAGGVIPPNATLIFEVELLSIN
jgi:FKBP-type peptidyl-prolyl cis-trans isomerase FklB